MEKKKKKKKRKNLKNLQKKPSELKQKKKKINVHFEKVITNCYLGLDFGVNYLIYIYCHNYKPAWDIYKNTEDYYEKYLAKLSLIDDIIKIYNFDDKTYFY